MQPFKWLNLLFVFTLMLFIAGCGGVVLSGTVKNSSTGQPIEGVMIEGKSTTANHPLTPVKTTADGAFRIENLKKGETYQLTFKKETVTPKKEEYSLAKMGKAAENLTILLNEFFVIKGKAFKMEGGGFQPVRDATVELLEKQSNRWVSVSDITDHTKPDGSFIISGILKPGNYCLRISEASYQTIYYPSETSPKPLKKGDVWKIEDGEIVLEPESFLLRIESVFQRDLETASISRELRQEFEKKGIRLSQDATIRTQEKDTDIWLITSDEQEYMIRREEGQLNMYRKTTIEPGASKGREPGGWVLF